MKAETTGYLAPLGFEEQLRCELREKSRIVGQHGRLFLAEGAPLEPHWCHNIWRAPRRLAVKSISDAARQLKSLQRSWWPYEFHLHRRMALIQEQLPRVAAPPLAFPAELTYAPLGSWTLLDPETMLAAPECSSPFPNGEPTFAESKPEPDGPPSRAYLKLFEAFTKLGVMPSRGERCLELGAAPGGWTWVLARLGAHVDAFDRAELAPNVASMAGVTWRQGDAFKAKPAEIGAIDWLFSDIICYPDKLLEFVSSWLASGLCRNFLCTLKFQGDQHYGTIAKFAAIPGSKILHLSANKHELTWALVNCSS